MNIKAVKTKKTAAAITETKSVIPPAEKTVVKKTTPQKITVAKPAVKKQSSEKVTEKPAKKGKVAVEKVIRDSFSFPEIDYLKISAIKKICLSEGMHVKKGEILRAGLLLLEKLNPAELKQAIEQVEKVKTGRPASSKK